REPLEPVTGALAAETVDDHAEAGGGQQREAGGVQRAGEAGHADWQRVAVFAGVEVGDEKDTPAYIAARRDASDDVLARSLGEQRHVVRLPVEQRVAQRTGGQQQAHAAKDLAQTAGKQARRQAEEPRRQEGPAERVRAGEELVANVFNAGRFKDLAHVFGGAALFAAGGRARADLIAQHFQVFHQAVGLTLVSRGSKHYKPSIAIGRKRLSLYHFAQLDCYSIESRCVILCS